MNFMPINPLELCHADLDLPDGAQRFEAIHPGQSYIVQAPAGSGKTALLTQRFLALLSQVAAPEQVVAMTFTKKAAAEMRQRILETLKLGKAPLADDADLFQRNSWHLARAALQNNDRRQWQLLDNPNRLRIRTLDSMNGYLVQQMPLLSRLGSQPQVSERQDQLFSEAARAALNDPDATQASAELLQLVNGKLRSAEALLVSMLKKRDQWMGVLFAYDRDDEDAAANARLELEEAIVDLVEQEKQAALKGMQPVLSNLSAICQFAEFAERNVADESLKAAWQALADHWQSQQALSQSTDLPIWRALAQCLQTQQGLWAKTVTKTKGFPPGKGENKTTKDAFLAELEDIRTADFQDHAAEALQQLSQLPDPRYADDQWQSLQRLIRLLRRSVAHLKWCFQQAGQTDFIEVAQAAALALGEEDSPTDLAQQLDYQLQHLLIDEFQDTSAGQSDLVKKLVSGWQPGDGHTLFIVGDPMQSIYRFREAEVGNFLQAWQGQLGSLPLTPLQLSVNFRSSVGIVDWVNQTFNEVFPRENQLELGAVRYAQAIASQSASNTTSEEAAVHCHWGLSVTDTEAVANIVAVIQQRLQTEDFSEKSVIGVLGRSRSHLMPIAVALKQAGIAFRAVELEGLKDRQEIQDCQSLTRALLHLGDRPAWIALLRSPLVGLSLADLACLLTEDGRPTSSSVWQGLELFLTQKTTPKTTQNDQAWSNLSAELSEEGQQRLMAVLPVLQQSLKTKGAVPIAIWLRQTWLALDGPQTVLDENALQNVDAYWQMLARLADDTRQHSLGGAISIAALDETLAKFYALPDASNEARRVELMTMHKSKGLEFDTVILPSLGRKSRNDDAPLISWLTFKSAQKEQLVIAPLPQKGKVSVQTQPSDLVGLIKRYEDQKQAYEWARLLYVACTRAKRRLHCFGSIKVSDKVLAGEAELTPIPKSLLACLWPVQKTAFDDLLTDYVPPEPPENQASVTVKVSRLPLDRQGFWQLPIQNAMSRWIPRVDTPSSSQSESKPLAVNPLPSSSLDQEWVKTVGIWVHQVLEQWAKSNLLLPTIDALAAQRDRHRLGLMQLGLRDPFLESALQRVMQSLRNVLQNERMQWALRSDHAEAAAEWPLSSLETTPSGALQANHIVDRSFVDEAGQRWIIDYKTSSFGKDVAADEIAPEKMAAFIESQVAVYRPQLQRYGDLIGVLDHRPQRWVLYFTHLDQWVEVASE